MRLTGERTAEINGQITARGVTHPATQQLVREPLGLRVKRDDPTGSELLLGLEFELG